MEHASSGPGHRLHWTAILRIGSTLAAKGEGDSKRQANANAYAQMVAQLERHAARDSAAQAGIQPSSPPVETPAAVDGGTDLSIGTESQGDLQEPDRARSTVEAIGQRLGKRQATMNAYDQIASRYKSDFLDSSEDLGTSGECSSDFAEPRSIPSLTPQSEGLDKCFFA